MVEKTLLTTIMKKNILPTTKSKLSLTCKKAYKLIFIRLSKRLKHLSPPMF